jgi:hypothetical protein
MPEGYILDLEGIGPILIERSTRARHMNISVRPYKGVRIAVPYGVSFKEAERLAHRKFRWIEKHVNEMKEVEKRLENQPPDIPLHEAHGILSDLVARYAQRYGFKYNRLMVKSLRSRWGSCSPKNNINLNVKILRLPPQLRDYVILHELVHTRFKNHGPSFWKTLSEVCGVAEAKELDRQLKTFGIAAI